MSRGGAVAARSGAAGVAKMSPSALSRSVWKARWLALTVALPAWPGPKMAAREPVLAVNASPAAAARSARDARDALGEAAEDAAGVGGAGDGFCGGEGGPVPLYASDADDDGDDDGAPGGRARAVLAARADAATAVLGTEVVWLRHAVVEHPTVADGRFVFRVRARKWSKRRRVERRERVFVFSFRTATEAGEWSRAAAAAARRARRRAASARRRREGRGAGGDGDDDGDDGDGDVDGDGGSPGCAGGPAPSRARAVRAALRALYPPGVSGFSDCLTEGDKRAAAESGSSLLYGEVLPAGVDRLMDADHLDAASAAVLVDLGAGLGKLAVQCFLQFPGLRRVVGVELAWTRYAMSRDALSRLAQYLADGSLEGAAGAVRADEGRGLAAGLGADRALRLTLLPARAARTAPGDDAKERGDTPQLRGDEEDEEGDDAELGEEEEEEETDAKERGDGPEGAEPPAACAPRTIEVRRGNMFDAPDLGDADIVVLETMVPAESYARLARLLASLRPGCRVLTFANLRAPEFMAVYGGDDAAFPLEQLPANVPAWDRFLTTWNRRRGHHFHLWRRLGAAP